MYCICSAYGAVDDFRVEELRFQIDPQSGANCDAPILVIHYAKLNVFAFSLWRYTSFINHRSKHNCLSIKRDLNCKLLSICFIFHNKV